MSVIFSLSAVHERTSLQAFEVLTAFTSAKRQKLNETDIVALEVAFNRIDARLPHLFLPWVRSVNLMSDSASRYLDVRNLATVVTKIVRSAATRSEDALARIREFERTTGIQTRRITV